MPAYAIGRLTMRDPSWVAEYGPKAAETIERHGGKYLVRGGKMARLEGGNELPDLMVVLEFPSMEEAQAWYDDPGYVPLIALRQTGSDMDFVLVDGVG